MTDKKPLHIIKIGGNIIDNPAKLQQFLADFAQINAPKLLVHGGGKTATELANQMQLPQEMIDGRRVTNAETLKLITMVYGGLINKNIVAALAAQEVLAIGLSGADANTVIADKRPVNPIDYGFVGDVKSVNNQSIKKLLDAGFTPVFCALTHDAKGQLLNTNADTMAAVIAAAMSEDYAVQLNYCFEKKGVLRSVDDDNSVITKITPDTYAQLKADNIIFKGMLPKLDNAFFAVNHGAEAVYILQAEDVLSRVLTQSHYGTKIIA